MNRAKLCRPGNRRWIHDGVIVDRKTVPACRRASVDRWHRLPNNMTTNCPSCLRQREFADTVKAFDAQNAALQSAVDRLRASTGKSATRVTDGRVYIQTGARRRYFDRLEDAQRVAEAIFDRTGVVVGIENGGQS